MVSQKQGNENASWVYSITAIVGSWCICAPPKSQPFGIYIICIHIRGAFSVARFDLPGNAKALTRGTSIRTGSTFFLFVCRHHLKLPVKKELLAKTLFIHENNTYIIIYALSPVCCSEHGNESLNNWRL